jgi:hypothetical protein
MPLNKEHQAIRALSVLLKQPSTYASVALIGLLDLFPEESLSWEPKTWQLEIRDTIGINIEPDMFDKIMAARQVITADNVFNELPAFITVINALNGDGVDTPVSQPIDPADLCWGILEMCLLYPPSTEESFSEEIIGYIEECLKWQGVNGIPKVLQGILPEQQFDEIMASDPDVMQNIFNRLVDINDEVDSNLRAWKYQMNQLKLVNGSMDWLNDNIKTAESFMLSRTSITISCPKNKNNKNDKASEEHMKDFLELFEDDNIISDIFHDAKNVMKRRAFNGKKE